MRTRCTSTGLARVAVPLLAGALLLAATVVPTAISAGAAANAPTPAARSFGSVADAFPRYERENSCRPTQKPGAKALRKLLRNTYGSSIGSSTVRACTSSDSGHEEGRAVDWMTDKSVASEKAKAKAFLAWMQATDSYGNTYAMARRIGIQYVIWNNRMWRAYDTGRGWTEYNNCLHKSKKGKKAWANACHRTHVHFSLNWDGAYKRTSYFSGYVVCPTFYPQLPPPSPAVRGEFVNVSSSPARILTTKSGNGMPNGPCRVRGGSPVDLRVLGRGGVPSAAWPQLCCASPWSTRPF